MTRADQRLLWAPFATAAVILAVWYFVWRSGADAMRGALADFAADQEQSGASFIHEPLRAKGFPFLLRGEIDAVAYTRGAWRWEADAVHLHASPWAPNRIVFSAGPSMRLREPKGLWTITAEGARASIETADSVWLFKAEAASLEGVKDDTSVKTGRGVINVTPDATAEDAFAVSFRLFGTTIKNPRGAAEMARLDGALSLDTTARRLTIHGLDSEISGARAQLAGALGADSAGFLDGALTATFTNPAALGAPLRVTGVVKAEDQSKVEAGLALIAAGGGTIEAPLVFNGGQTRLAGVTIGKAPKVGQP